MTESTSLVLHSQTGVLSRIGTPQERTYLIEIMAQQIGIPRSDAGRADVIALLGAAAQRTMQYGWVPGIHMHVQKFETDKSKKARERDPKLSPVYTYTLVDGEKAWKDSGTRWRDRGVNWRYQRKPMTLEEVAEEARLMGFTDKIASNSFGIWSRIIIEGQDDPNDQDNPFWSAGVYFGKVRAGKFWYFDALPSGTSARDVALRRADKHAMMQSQLTLLPVDDMGPSARIHKLEEALRNEAAARVRVEAIQQHPQRALVEDDGDMLWADEPTATARPAAPVVEVSEAHAPVDMDFYGDVVAEPDEDDEPLEADARPVHGHEKSGARPGGEPENLGARPGATSEKSGARPVNSGPGSCPSCHAPEGKLHATQCTASAPENSGARPAASAPEVDARPEQTPKKVDARPAASARPQEPDPASALYQSITRIYTSDIPLTNAVTNLIRKARNAHTDSAVMMSAKYMQTVYTVLGETLWADGDEVDLLLAALLGFRITSDRRPGQLVHGHIIKPIRDDNKEFIAALTMLLEICRGIMGEHIEEAALATENG